MTHLCNVRSLFLKESASEHYCRATTTSRLPNFIQLSVSAGIRTKAVFSLFPLGLLFAFFGCNLILWWFLKTSLLFTLLSVLSKHCFFLWHCFLPVFPSFLLWIPGGSNLWSFSFCVFSLNIKCLKHSATALPLYVCSLTLFLGKSFSFFSYFVNFKSSCSCWRVYFSRSSAWNKQRQSFYILQIEQIGFFSKSTNQELFSFIFVFF